MPSIKNSRNLSGASQRPSTPVKVAKSPITKEPLTFTNKVPQGKVCPTALAIHPENSHRAKLPSPPPIKIHSAFHIIPTRHICGVGRSYQPRNSSGGSLATREGKPHCLSSK